jgi:TRAP-type C4-dicarboxylate transport system permease large subunit
MRLNGLGKALLTVLVGASLLMSAVNGSAASKAAEKPNILFIIMDDVGMDQMKVFGFGGTMAGAEDRCDVESAAQQ